jgi:hypothetical protein
VHLALVLLLASPAPSSCPTPTPAATASASPSPLSSASPEPTVTPTPSQTRSPAPCATATSPTSTASPAPTATATPTATPPRTATSAPALPPAAYRAPLSFQPFQSFTDPVPPTDPQSSGVEPVPQGTYRPALPYQQQSQAGRAIAEPDREPGPLATKPVPGVSRRGGSPTAARCRPRPPVRNESQVDPTACVGSRFHSAVAVTTGRRPGHEPQIRRAPSHRQRADVSS